MLANWMNSIGAFFRSAQAGGFDDVSSGAGGQEGHGGSFYPVQGAPQFAASPAPRPPLSAVPPSVAQPPYAQIIMHDGAGKLKRYNFANAADLEGFLEKNPNMLGSKDPMERLFGADNKQPMFSLGTKTNGIPDDIQNLPPGQPLISFANDKAYADFLTKDPQRLEVFGGGMARGQVDRPLPTDLALSRRPLGLWNPPIDLGDFGHQDTRREGRGIRGGMGLYLPEIMAGLPSRGSLDFRDVTPQEPPTGHQVTRAAGHQRGAGADQSVG